MTEMTAAGEIYQFFFLMIISLRVPTCWLVIYKLMSVVTAAVNLISVEKRCAARFSAMMKRGNEKADKTIKDEEDEDEYALLSLFYSNFSPALLSLSLFFLFNLR